MLKSFFDVFKTLFGLTDDNKKNKDEIKALQTKFEVVISDVRQIASDADADRRVAAEQRKTAESNYENLVLRLQLALKDMEQRALPPGSTSQNTPELEARVIAIENTLEELKRQIEELKKP